MWHGPKYHSKNYEKDMACRILQNNDEEHRDFAEKKKHWKTNIHILTELLSW